MSAVPWTPTEGPAVARGPVGHDCPTTPEDAPLTWLPTPRVRAAETLAHAVLTGSVPSERLCTIVADLRRDLGVDHAQVSIISDRQIALVVDGRLSDLDDHDPDAPVVSALENTLCVIAMRADKPVRIDDAAADQRTASTPPVTSGRIGSYLGSPIRTASAGVEGSQAALRVGVLCIYHSRPHTWTNAEGKVLDQAAAAVGEELQTILGLVGRPAPPDQVERSAILESSSS